MDDDSGEFFQHRWTKRGPKAHEAAPRAAKMRLQRLDVRAGVAVTSGVFGREGTDRAPADNLFGAIGVIGG